MAQAPSQQTGPGGVPRPETAYEKWIKGTGLPIHGGYYIEDARTIEEVYEPYLIKEGFVQRTSRGRKALDKTFAYLNVENPNKYKDGESFTDNINPNSLKIIEGCKLEPSLKDSKLGDYLQFLRNGYFASFYELRVLHRSYQSGLEAHENLGQKRPKPVRSF